MSYTTLWEVPDGLWNQIKQVLPREKRNGSVGRPALPNRQVVNGILFVLRSGSQWKWQAVDSKMVSAPIGGDLTGPNPTDRAKSGSKRHIWVDQRGAPLSICITAANAHDVTEIMNLLNCPIVRRPRTQYRVQHFMCR